MQVLQKQKNVPKLLTIEQIAPKWAKVLALGKKLNDKQRIEMKNLEKCVVGEAHGYKDSYYTHIEKYCPDCVSFSMELPFYYTESTLKDSNRQATGSHYFDMTMYGFVQHFNEKHSKEFDSRVH